MREQIVPRDHRNDAGSDAYHTDLISALDGETQIRLSLIDQEFRHLMETKAQPGFEFKIPSNPYNVGIDGRPVYAYCVWRETIEDESDPSGAEVVERCRFIIKPGGSTQVLKVIANRHINEAPSTGRAYAMIVYPTGDDVVDVYEPDDFDLDEGTTVDFSEGSIGVWVVSANEERCAIIESEMRGIPTDPDLADEKFESTIPYNDPELPAEFWETFDEIRTGGYEELGGHEEIVTSLIEFGDGIAKRINGALFAADDWDREDVDDFFE